jgi:hypothetical protein
MVAVAMVGGSGDSNSKLAMLRHGIQLSFITTASAAPCFATCMCPCRAPDELPARVSRHCLSIAVNVVEAFFFLSVEAACFCKAYWM